MTATVRKQDQNTQEVKMNAILIGEYKTCLSFWSSGLFQATDKQIIH